MSTTVPVRPDAQRDLRSFRLFDLLLSVFVVILLISNLVGQKLVAVGWFRISGAQLLFPLTYIFGDIFTEVYGYAASRRAIWLGFLASGLMAFLGIVIVLLPPAPDWPNQQAFATVFYQVPRLVVASLVAYWCGEFANSFVMAKMKLMTEGKMLWLRTIGSTVAGQLVDTIVLALVGFLGVFTIDDLFRFIVSGYLGKVLYEAAMTPVTYAVVNGLKRYEGVDVFDRDADFNPFHLSRS
jgi:uncharacterized integral membrane protein (TIGR00697 family)